MQEAQQKQWYWSPTETFNVKGEFINLTVHLLQEVLSTPEARKFALALELDKLVGDVMREGIDQGKITDSPPPYPEKTSPLENWLKEEGIKISNEIQKIEVSSINPKMLGILTSDNHLSTLLSTNNISALSEILGWQITKLPYEAVSNETFCTETLIERWAEEDMEKDEEGRIKDLIVFIRNGGIGWIPKVELNILHSFKGSSHITWGYIDGRRNHLGCFATKAHNPVSSRSGYVIFIEGNKSVKEKIFGFLPSVEHNDLNHYKNMSPEEFSAVFGNTIHQERDKAKPENQYSFDLEPSEKEFVLDGKYWIPKAEKEILKQFEGKSIQFGYKESETKDKYILWINTL